MKKFLEAIMVYSFDITSIIVCGIIATYTAISIIMYGVKLIDIISNFIS